MTPQDVHLIARCIAECKMHSMEAELMRARIAGRIARYISSALPVGAFYPEKFFNDADLRVPANPSESAFIVGQDDNVGK